MSPYAKANHTMQALLQREKELKRSRGEIACAECRRLKLRCDRKVPCSSCVRRGCQSICPNGKLSGGQGTRFVLADTEELHLKLVDMSERIRELEDALEASHNSNSAGPHPLLCNDLKATKYLVGHNIASEADIPRHVHDPLDSFGALKISDDGESRFLGPSAGSEGILLSEVISEKREGDENPQVELPPRIYELSRMWPFTPIDLPKDDIRIIIEAQLPAWDRATALYESYVENFGWYNMPVDRQQIVEELLPSIYKRPSNLSASPESDESLLLKADNHELALLLMVFACGAATDPTREPKNEEGQLYYHLARTALGLQPIFEKASLSTVQSLTLMALYDVVAIRKDNLEESWKMIFLASIIAGSIGLHRDPGRWKLEPKIMERRRKVFWEMYLTCTWQCLAGGRPPPFVRPSVDVQLPEDSYATMSDDGKTTPSYKMWKLRFLDECLAPVTDRICADTTPLKYYEILNFDKKIREFPDIDGSCQCSDQLDNSDGAVPLSQRNKVLCYKSGLRVYIHRNFFVKAISEFPGNPRQPPFGASFMVVFDAAVSVLDMLYQMRTKIDWIVHLWPTVAHALECGFIVGSVAMRCPRTVHAKPAFKSLEMAIGFFHCIKHPVAQKGLPVLFRLREKAQQAMYSSHVVPSNSLPSSSSTIGKEDDLDELSILRGSSRLVAHSSEKRLSSTKPTSADAVVDPSFAGEAIAPQGVISNYPLTEPGVPVPSHIPAYPSGQNQLPSVSFPDYANPVIWADLLDQTGQQPYQANDFAANISVDDQTFANLVPDAFSSLSSDIPQFWNFGGNQYSF